MMGRVGGGGGEVTVGLDKYDGKKNRTKNVHKGDTKKTPN